MKKILLLISFLILSGCTGCSTIKFGDTKVYSSKIEEKQVRDTVIILHTAGGPQWSSEWVDIFHNAGYNAIMLDYISGRGYSSITGLNAPISINDTLEDIALTIEYVSSAPWHKNKIIIIGFSFGGGLVTSITDIKNIKNRGVEKYKSFEKVTDLIAVYPLCGLGMPTSDTKAKVQFHFGTEDWWTHESSCMLDRTDSSKFKIFRYEGARHGWDCYRCSHPSITYNKPMSEQLIKNIFENLK